MLKLAGRPLIVFRSDIHSEMPSSSVLMPSVTTIVFTPATTTSTPLTTPTSSAASTATTDAGHTPQWWLTTSTGRIVADVPNTAGTDRSTNSPTLIVHSRAMAMNTSGCCELKMVWNVGTRKNRPGSPDGRRHRQNGFLLAVDVSAFLPLDEFTATVDATVDAIKALPPIDAAAEVLVPGERGRRCEADRRVSGVPLGAKVWRELSGAADTLGVAVPTPLDG